MKCPFCQTVNIPKAVFCMKCKKKLLPAGKTDDDRYGLRDEDFSSAQPKQSDHESTVQPLAADWQTQGDTPAQAHTPVMATPPAPPTTPPASGYAAAMAEGRNIYAGFWERVGAYLIDSIIRFVFLIGLLLILVFLFNAGSGLDMEETNGEMAFQLIYQLSSALLSLFYFAWFHSRSGATPGKKLLKLRVVNSQGMNPSFLHACGRWFASFFSMFFYIGFIMAAFTDRKQALHDMIAKTHVIHKDTVLDASLPASLNGQRKTNGCMIAGIVGAVCFVPLMAILAAIALPAYQDYTVRAHLNSALSEMETVKLRTETFYDQYSAFPERVEDLGLETEALPVTNININQGTGIIAFSPDIQSGTKDISIQFVPQIEDGEMVWYCVLDGLSQNRKPLSCRDSFDD